MSRNDPSVDEESEAADQIAAIKGMRLTDGTKRGYENKNKLFAAYLTENYPTMVEDEQILIEEVSIESFQSFIVQKQRDGLSFSACSVHKPSFPLPCPRPWARFVFPPL